MKISSIYSVGAGLYLDYNNPELSNYYGVLEFGENFCQYSVYDKNNKLILKRFGDPDRDLFVKEQNNPKYHFHSKFNLVSITENNPHESCYIELYGDKNYLAFGLWVGFLKSSAENDGKLTEYLDMKYDYLKKR